jgi:hypothetical protein
MLGERTDRLRRRPDVVRYVYVAESNKDLHTGLSWSGLNYARTKYTVKTLILCDLVTNRVFTVVENVDSFMKRWRLHYNDPTWDYEKEIGGK